MSTATVKKPAVTNCRLCGNPFPHRLLASFEGIEVWERRYCIPCSNDRIAAQNKWDTDRIVPRQATETREPGVLFADV